jgi:hypothetical protein
MPSQGRDGRYTVFMTNRADGSPDTAQGLCARYSRRWDIENEYKSIKKFLPMMVSTDYRVRLFNFVFAVLLYNIWRLTDYSLKATIGTDVREAGCTSCGGRGDCRRVLPRAGVATRSHPRVRRR